MKDDLDVLKGPALKGAVEKVSDLYQLQTCLNALNLIISEKDFRHSALRIKSFFPIKSSTHLLPDGESDKMCKPIPILECELTRPNGVAREISVTHMPVILEGIMTRLFNINYRRKIYPTPYCLRTAAADEAEGRNPKGSKFYLRLLKSDKPFHISNGKIEKGANTHTQLVLSADAKKKPATPPEKKCDSSIESATKADYVRWKEQLEPCFKNNNYKEALLLSDRILGYTLKHYPDKKNWLKICYKNLAICHQRLGDWTSAKTAWFQVELIEQQLTQEINPDNTATRKFHKCQRKRNEEKNSIKFEDSPHIKLSPRLFQITRCLLGGGDEELLTTMPVFSAEYLPGGLIP